MSGIETWVMDYAVVEAVCFLWTMTSFGASSGKTSFLNVFPPAMRCFHGYKDGKRLLLTRHLVPVNIFVWFIANRGR